MGDYKGVGSHPSHEITQAPYIFVVLLSGYLNEYKYRSFIVIAIQCIVQLKQKVNPLKVLLSRNFRDLS